jgi:hypothetical protein
LAWLLLYLYLYKRLLDCANLMGRCYRYVSCLHYGHWTYFTLCNTPNMWHFGRSICFQIVCFTVYSGCVYIAIAIFDRFYFTWHHAYNSCALHFHRNLKCKKVLFEWNIKSDKKCMKLHNIIRTTVYFLRQTHLTDSYINDESVPRKQRD